MPIKQNFGLIYESNGNIPPQERFLSVQYMRHSSNHGDGQVADDSILAIAVNMIAAPREALQTLKLKTAALAPLSVIVIANAAIILAYYSQVDLTWLVETDMQNSPRELTQEQREAAADFMGDTSPMLLGSIGALAATVVLALLFVLNAAWLSGISLLSNDGIGFRYWFSMICWCALPLVFGYAASLVNLFVSDATFLPADRINPLSFSSLLNIESANGRMLRQSMQSLDITAIWSMALVVFGYHTWTQRSLLKSALIVFSPAVLIFGTILYVTSG